MFGGSNMKEQILEEIKKNNKITYKNLLKKFNVGHRELDNLLLELKLDAEILQVKNKYMIFPEGLNIGTVIVSSSGRKYILHDDEKVSIASNFFNKSKSAFLDLTLIFKGHFLFKNIKTSPKCSFFLFKIFN